MELNRFFSPNGGVQLQVGFRNAVEVDCSRHGVLTTVEQYQKSVGDTTWKATMKYITSLKERGTKIAFFNSTPQGGGVALMRHALIRFLRAVNVNCKW